MRTKLLLGGAFVVGGRGVTHFLFAAAAAARTALEAAGIHVLKERDVLVQLGPGRTRSTRQDFPPHGRGRRQHRGALQRPQPPTHPCS